MTKDKSSTSEDFSLIENFVKLDLQIKKFVLKPNRTFGIPI